METALVGDEAGFAVEGFRAEAECEGVGERTSGGNDRAERIVDASGGGGAVFGDVAHDVAVVVVKREVERAVDANGEESPDATRALLRAGEVRSPEIFCW